MATTFVARGIDVINGVAVGSNSSAGTDGAGQITVLSGQQSFADDAIVEFFVENEGPDGELNAGSGFSGVRVYATQADFDAGNAQFVYEPQNPGQTANVQSSVDGLGDTYVRFNANVLVSNDPGAPVLQNLFVAPGSNAGDNIGSLTLDHHTDIDFNQNTVIEGGTNEARDGEFSVDYPQFVYGGPGGDGIVEGTSGDDVIDAGYTGDPEQDLIDANDGINGTSGDEDLVVAGSGDDVIASGAADDTVFAGFDDDIVNAGEGDDTIFGDLSSADAVGRQVTPLDLDAANVRAGSQTGTDGQAQIGDSVIYDDIGQLSDGTIVAARVTLVDVSDPALGVDLTGPAGFELVVNVGRVAALEGETAQFRLDFIDQTTGDPLVLTGKATWGDIDEAIGGTERVTISQEQFSGYETSQTPIITVAESDGNIIASGNSGGTNIEPDNEDAWFTGVFEDRGSLEFTVTSRGDNSGFSLNGETITDPLSTTFVQGDDDLTGGEGDDTIYGHGGDDVITGDGAVTGGAVTVNGVLIAEEDFTGAATGWSNNSTFALNDGDDYLGRFGDTNGQIATQKTFALDQSFTGMVMEFDFKMTDSWDLGERFFVEINGEEVGSLDTADRNAQADTSQTFTASDGTIYNVEFVFEGTSSQGGAGFSDTDYSVRITSENPPAQVQVGFGSTLNQPATDESFGIDNFTLASVNDVTADLSDPATFAVASDPYGDDALFGGDGADTIYGDQGTAAITNGIGATDGPNLIVNGNFEDFTGLSQTGYGYVGIGGVPGWTATDPSIDVDIHNNDKGGISGTDGNALLETGGSPNNLEIYQDVTGLTSGDTYRLTLDVGDTSSDNDNLTEVFWGGVKVGELDPADFGQIESFSFDLVAGAGDGTDRLLLREIGAIDNDGLVIDNVQLRALEFDAGGDDVIDGGAGDDLLFGQGGDDTIEGGAGADRIEGGAGADKLSGGDDDDLIIANDDAPTTSNAFGGAGVATPEQIGHWDFDDPSDPLDDDAAIDNDALLRGGAITQNGGVELDGSDDYIEIPHDPSYELSSATVRTVIEFDALNGQSGIFSKDSNDFDNGGHLTLWANANGALELRIQDDVQSYTVTSPAGTVTTGQDYDIQVAFDNATQTATVFVDGVAVATGNNIPVDLTPNTEPWVLGADQTTSGDGIANNINDNTDGRISLFEIYNQALTPAELDSFLSGEGDSISGGQGSDTIFANGGDYVDGNEDPGDTDTDTLFVEDVQSVQYKDDAGNNVNFETENGIVTFNDGTTLQFENIENLIVANPDGIVEGTDGNDVIDATYLGDPDGDLIDNGDAVLAGEAPNDDIVLAKAGDDIVQAGLGDDDIYGGAGDDTLNGEDGNDTIYGDQNGGAWLYEYYDLDPNGDPRTLAQAGFTEDGGRNHAAPPTEVGYANTITPADYDTQNDYALKFTSTIVIAQGGTYTFNTNSDDGSQLFVDGVLVVDNDGHHAPRTITDTVTLGPGEHTIEIVFYENNGGNVLQSSFSGPDTGNVLTDLVTWPGLVIGAGDDTINGGAGNDDLFGEGGDDTFVFEDGFGLDVIEGGETAEDTGGDHIDGSALTDDATVVLSDDEEGSFSAGPNNADFEEIEEITTGSGDDSVDLSSDTSGLTVSTGSGEDVVTSGAGADDIDTGADADTIFVSDVGDADGDTIDGGSTGDDNDTLDLTGSTPIGGSKQIITSVDSDGNGFDGVVNYFDQNNTLIGSLQFENIETIIPCFTPGTMITTIKGEVAVEDLGIGARVLTRDNGFQAIEWVGRRTLSKQELRKNSALRPVRISAGALGNGLPRQDMLVSPQHRLLVAGAQVEMYFAAEEVLVPAINLVSLDGVEQVVPKDGITYVHIMFHQHEVIMSDGAWSESFQPGDQTLAGMDEAQRTEIFALFPELLSSDPSEVYPAARMTVRGKEAPLLFMA